MYDVILPTVSTVTRPRRGRQKRWRAWRDVLSPSSENSEQIASFRALFTVFRPSAGGRHGRQWQLFRRNMERKPTVQATATSMLARWKDADEKELLARVSYQRLWRSRPGGNATSDGRSTDDEWPGDRWRESNAKIVKPSGITCKATTSSFPTIVWTSSSIVWHGRRTPRTTAVSTLRYLAYLESRL